MPPQDTPQQDGAAQKPSAPAKLINFADLVAARMKARTAAAAEEAAYANPASLEEREPTTSIGSLALWHEPWQFSLQDTLIDEDGRVLFPNQRVEAHVAKVFSRWGFNLADFTSRVSDMQAAYNVFNLHFGRATREMAGILFFSNERHPEVSLEYVEAVHAGDRKTVKRLFKSSGIAQHMQKWRDHEAAREVAADEPRKPRSDARGNPVIGVLLAMPIKGARNGETLGDFVQDFLRRARLVDQLLHEEACGRGTLRSPNESRKLDPQLQLDDMRYTPAFKALRSMGLVPLSHCPRYEETAVLFDKELLAAYLDASDLRDSWRADIGPFVGFDTDMRLIIEKDLAWWRLDWHHAEAFAGSPVPVAQLPLEPGAKLVKLARWVPVPQPADADSKKKAHASTARLSATFHFDGLKHVLRLGEHVLHHESPFLLGGLAAMCGFKTVATDVDERPFQPLVLKALKSSHWAELRQSVERTEHVEAYRKFHEGLRMVSYPEKMHGGGQGERLRAWWNQEYAKEAAELAPKGMLRIEKL